MVCKADTRFILVRAERPYLQCSLLLMLLCTEVLVVGGIQAGRERDSSQVSVCGCVRVSECMLSTLPLLGVVQHVLSRVLPSPFIVCKGRGRVTVSRCMKIERKGLRCSLFLAFLSVRAFAQSSSWWWHAVAVDVSQLMWRGHTLTWCHDEEDFVALKLRRRKGGGPGRPLLPVPLRWTWWGAA
jgi:hypothetical protein